MQNDQDLYLFTAFCGYHLEMVSESGAVIAIVQAARTQKTREMAGIYTGYRHSSTRARGVYSISGSLLMLDTLGNNILSDIPPWTLKVLCAEGEINFYGCEFLNEGGPPIEILPEHVYTFLAKEMCPTKLSRAPVSKIGDPYDDSPRDLSASLVTFTEPKKEESKMATKETYRQSTEKPTQPPMVTTCVREDYSKGISADREILAKIPMQPGAWELKRSWVEVLDNSITFFWEWIPELPKPSQPYPSYGR